jgi:hypothetical protein
MSTGKNKRKKTRTKDQIKMIPISAHNPSRELRLFISLFHLTKNLNRFIEIYVDVDFKRQLGQSSILKSTGQLKMYKKRILRVGAHLSKGRG